MPFTSEAPPRTSRSTTNCLNSSLRRRPRVEPGRMRRPQRQWREGSSPCARCDARTSGGAGSMCLCAGASIVSGVSKTTAANGLRKGDRRTIPMSVRRSPRVFNVSREWHERLGPFTQDRVCQLLKSRGSVSDRRDPTDRLDPSCGGWRRCLRERPTNIFEPPGRARPRPEARFVQL